MLHILKFKLETISQMSARETTIIYVVLSLYFFYFDNSVAFLAPLLYSISS